MDKFRRKKEPKHIRLYASITGSEAWRHLSGNAIKVLVALVARDDGTRNGELGFSCRDAANVTGLSVRTCWRCFVELQEKGFIVCTNKGGFNRKVLHATLWRYTWAPWPGGKPAAPTRDFEKWQPDGNSRLQILSGTDASFVREQEKDPSPVADIATRNLETAHVPALSDSAKSATLIVYQGDERSDLETGQRKQANSCTGAFLASLRHRLIEHVEMNGPGAQSALADKLGIPPATLSKFKNGRNLPAEYRQPLAEAVAIY